MKAKIFLLYNLNCVSVGFGKICGYPIENESLDLASRLKFSAAVVMSCSIRAVWLDLVCSHPKKLQFALLCSILKVCRGASLLTGAKVRVYIRVR